MTSHLFSIPWSLSLINDTTKLLKYYTNMMVMFTNSSTGIWVLSIQSNNKVQQLSNSDTLLSSKNYMYMRNSNGLGGFTSFINQSLVGGVDDFSESESSSYSSSKIIELLNEYSESSNSSMYDLLQTGDIIYDDFFKYITTQSDSGKITFDITGFNSGYTDIQIIPPITLNERKITSFNEFLNTSAGISTSYDILVNHNSTNSFNYLSSSGLKIDFDDDECKIISDSFNNLNIVPRIPHLITSMSNSFNNINASGETLTLGNSYLDKINLSNCFTNCSMNIVILQYPILIDVSGNFNGCTGNLITGDSLLTKQTHSTLNIVSAEELTRIQYNDITLSTITEYTYAELLDLKNTLENDLNAGYYFTSTYDNFELKIYGTLWE